MNGKLLIGLDLGTTNAKAAAYTLQGRRVAEASVSYPTEYPAPGRAEQRPRDWTRALTDALRQAVAALGADKTAIAGIGLSAHGPGLVLLSPRGELLTETCPTWQDERAATYGQWLLDRVGPEWVGPGMPRSGFPARLLCLLTEQPDLAARAGLALGIKDYLVGWLTGQYYTEPSSGPGGDRWWQPVFDACGWDLDRLPVVLPSTALAGELRPALAADVGLDRPVPVVMGLNDGASATLGAGVTTPGDVIVTVATNGVVRAVVAESIPAQTRLDQGLFCWPYVDGVWIAGGFAKTGASALDWFARITGGEMNGDLRDRLVEEAGAAPPGSRGVLFVPYLAGRGTPVLDADSSAAFLNMTLAHGRGDLARAVLEGVAMNLRELFDHLRRWTSAPARLHVSGGGMQNALWRQIVADVFGLPLHRYAGDSTLGAAMMAAVGLGFYHDARDAARAMALIIDETLPRAEAVTIYEDVFRAFQSRRDALFPLADVQAVPLPGAGEV